MAIDFVLGRVKKSLFIRGIARIQVCGSNDPNANPFVAPGINVTSIFDGHFGVGSMEAADMFMGESILAANENFPQWPLIHKETPGTADSQWVKERKQGNSK
jgi:hypothetical protein